MASIFNIAQHKKKADPDAEKVLLAMWEGRDQHNPSQNICVRWSNDGDVLTAGCEDGCVRVYNVDGGKHAFTLGVPNAALGMTINANERLPVMAMRFSPTKQNYLRVASADGLVELYDLKQKGSRQTTKEIDESKNNKPNCTLCLDYNVDGTRWCSGGQDRTVRVYDENQPKKPLMTLTGHAGVPGHSNRICSVCFSPSPQHATVIASSGLDGTVLLWDTVRAARRAPQTHTHTAAERASHGFSFFFDPVLTRPSASPCGACARSATAPTSPL